MPPAPGFCTTGAAPWGAYRFTGLKGGLMLQTLEKRVPEPGGSGEWLSPILQLLQPCAGVLSEAGLKRWETEFWRLGARAELCL